MSDESSTTSDRFKEFSGEYFKRLVKGTATVYGGKAQDAVKLSADEELKLWLKPTSPAAKKAYELAAQAGLTAEQADEQANKANELWAHAMRGQQQIIRDNATQQGATPDQVNEILKQQGLTDEMIAAECRRHAYNLGKQNGQDDPAEEAKYHNRQAERAAALQQPMTYQTMPPQKPVAGAGEVSDAAVRN